MNSLVIYGSRYGNTEKIAYSVAAALRRHGPVQVVAVEEAAPAISKYTDLVIIGGPTEAHRVTPPLAQFFSQLEPGILRGKLAAAFDTRLSWPRWLAGSAASGIHNRLRSAGAQAIVAPESFLVIGNPPELAPGELDRAAGWGEAVAELAQNRAPAAAAV